jgi:hypothetical protein
MLLRGADKAACYPTENTPYDRASAEGLASVFSSKSNKGVAPALAASHGIGETEYICDGIAGHRITERERARGQAPRQELAAQCSDRGAP